MLKLVRLGRAGAYAADLEAFLAYKKIIYTAAVSRIGKYLIALTFMANFLSALFYNYSQDDGDELSWKSTFVLSTDGMLIVNH